MRVLLNLNHGYQTRLIFGHRQEKTFKLSPFYKEDAAVCIPEVILKPEANMKWVPW
jgi:hypothetical protein